MTNPGPGGPTDPAGNPHWQQPHQHPQQQPHEQQQWQQAQQQQWQQPQEQQWQQQQHQGGQFPQQPGQYPGQYPPGGYGGPPYGQQPKKSKRGLIIGLVVALVIALGGVGTWLALSLSSSSGAGSPDEAADVLLTALQDGDVIGMMDSLAPAESAVMSDMVNDYVKELKRIEILDQSADPENMSGFSLEATEELVFDPGKARKLNGHVTMAALVDGTIQFSGNFAEIPLADSFKNAILSPEDQAELQSENPNETIDIGAMVSRSGQPIYIATVQVDGEWYPSLFYTIAYYVMEQSGEQWPANPTPAVGADSPNAAVKALVEAIRTTDVQKVIEILPPDEMAVLHDLGPLLIDKANQSPDVQQDLPFQVTKLETDEESVSGGTRVTARELEMVITQDGAPVTLSVVRDGDCYHVKAPEPTKMCAADLADQIRFSLPSNVPSDAVEPIVQIAQKLFTQSFGVVTVEVDGKHYVSPLRTYGDLGLTMLKAIEPEHVRSLLQAIQGR